MSAELYHTIEQIGREKGLEADVIVSAIEEAYAAATRKYYQSKKDFGARLDRETGTFEIFSRQTVVDEEELAGVGDVHQPAALCRFSHARLEAADEQPADRVRLPGEKAPAFRVGFVQLPVGPWGGSRETSSSMS